MFTGAKRWEQLKCPSLNAQPNMVYRNKWNYYSALKGKEIGTHATTRVYFEDVMLYEISQSGKDKYGDSTYMRNLD